MRVEEIKRYIDRLNRNDFEETIFLRLLNENVILARVWEKEPELNDQFETLSYKFFFIKNNSGKYVGAVLDMTRDLFWYVLEKERKNGYLTKSLKEAIIPYLFSDVGGERAKQRITIENEIGEANYLSSKKVAQSLGFKSINDSETEFELHKDKFDWQFENIEERNGAISETRLKELRKRINLTYRQLIKISDELLMTYNGDEELRDVANMLSCFNLRIEDIERQNKRKNEKES